MNMLRGKNTVSQFCRVAILLFLTQICFAQTLTQTVRGRVVDGANNQPLIGANVQLIGTDFGTAVDTEGVFKMDNIPVGRYSLKASFIGYAPTVISEFWVQTGKEVVFDIVMASSNSVKIKSMMNKNFVAEIKNTMNIKKIIITKWILFVFSKVMIDSFPTIINYFS